MKNFLNALFGQAEGAFFVEGEAETSTYLSSLDELETYISNHPSTIVTSVVTDTDERVGFAHLIDDKLKGFLKPSLVITDGTEFVGVWLLEEPTKAVNENITLVKDFFTSDYFPIPTNGWRVVGEIDIPTTYNVMDLLTAIEKQSDGDHKFLHDVITDDAEFVESESNDTTKRPVHASNSTNTSPDSTVGADSSGTDTSVRVDSSAGSRLGDARLWGPKIAPEFLEREVNITIAKTAQTSDGWKPLTLTVGQLVSSLSRHKVGKKDGECILQGELFGTKRLSKNVTAQHLMILDLDTGDNVDKIKQWFLDNNTFGIIWTTHSHNATETSVEVKSLTRRVPAGQEPTYDDALLFLKEVKKYKQDVLDSCEFVEKVHENGIVFKISHKPLPKYRILTVLKEPYVLIDQPGSPDDGIRSWKEKYLGFALTLDVQTDTKCADLSRLMYLPRHPEGKTDYEIHVIGGAPLDIATLPSVDVRSGLEIGIDTEIDEAAKRLAGKQRTEFKTKGLAKFLATKAHTFRVSEFVDAINPEGNRGPAAQGAGVTQECPFEDQHTPPETGEDMGFYVVDAGLRGDTFVMHCSHESCPKDRGVLLDEFCQQHGVDVAELYRYCDDVDADEIVDTDEDEIGLDGKPKAKNIKPPELLVPNVHIEGNPNGGDPEAPREVLDPDLPDDRWGETIMTRDKHNVKWVARRIINAQGEPDIKELYTPLKITHLVIHPDNTEWHRWAIQTRNGRKVIDLGRQEAWSSQTSLPGTLSHQGAAITDAGAKHILQLARADALPLPVIHIHEKTGWFKHGDLLHAGFVTPIGEVLVGRGVPQGELEETCGASVQNKGKDRLYWDEGANLIASLKNNDHFQVALISGFLGPVIGLVRNEGFVIFYSGESTKGKTTAQRLGASVWGSTAPGACSIHSMKHTANAAEWMIALGNNTHVAFDETQFVQNPAELQNLVFTAAGGVGKSRSRMDGSRRVPHSWKTVVSISGETSFFTQLTSGGVTMKGGANARTLPVDVSDGIQLESAEINLILKMFDSYGHHGPLFVQYLIDNNWHKNYETLSEEIRKIADELTEIKNGDALTHRIAMMYATLQWTGLKAIDAGLLPKTLDVCGLVRRLWDNRDTIDAEHSTSVDKRGANMIAEHLISCKGTSFLSTDKFDHADPEEVRVNRQVDAYYRDGDIHRSSRVYLPKATLTAILDGLCENKLVIRYLRENGWLIKEDSMYVPGVGNRRHYVIDGSWLGMDGNDDDHDHDHEETD